jgi:drug/metabolite transporter (DMT)-like permease
VPHLSFAFLCLVWGSSFILTERARHAFGAVDVALGRVGGGALVLVVLWWFHRRAHRFTARDLWNTGLAALIGLVLPIVILSYCVAAGYGHSYFGMMVAFVPLATIAVSVPMLRIWPTAQQLIGVLGGLACIGLLVDVGSDRGMSSSLVALALLAPIGYAIGNTLIKAKLSHVPAIPLSAMLMLTGTAMILPLEFMPSAVERMHLDRPEVAHDVPAAIGALAFLGVVGTGIAIWLFNRLIIDRGPLFAGMVTYVFPLVALAWGRFDGEPLGIRQLAAMAGVLSMVALVQCGGGRTPNATERCRPNPRPLKSDLPTEGPAC